MKLLIIQCILLKLFKIDEYFINFKQLHVFISFLLLNAFKGMT